MWLPERITPAGPNSRTKASLTSWGWISQYTLASRTRRAISWVYCAPKSRIRIRSWPSTGDGCFWRALFDAVIWRFLHDLDVVDMGLAHAGGGDLDELRARA